MSMETWKAEFYPVEAIVATGSELEAAEHSLKKWEGRSPDNLKKHELHLSGIHTITDEDAGEDFDFNGNTCALCQYADNLACSGEANALITLDEIEDAHPDDDPNELLDHENCLFCPVTREFKRSCGEEYHAAKEDTGHSMRGLLKQLVEKLKAKEAK